MLTVTERLRQFAEEIRGQLTELISTHSQLYRSNEPGSGVFNLAGDHHRRPLSVDGRRIQAQVLEEYRRFSAILHGPGAAQRAVTEAERGIMAVIQQDGALWAARREDALAEALVALDAQVVLRDRLYGANESPTFVPDTNALLHNSALELVGIVTHLTSAGRADAGADQGAEGSGEEPGGDGEVIPEGAEPGSPVHDLLSYRRRRVRLQRRWETTRPVRVPDPTRSVIDGQARRDPDRATARR